MEKSKKYTIIDICFYCGLVIKAINALVEIIGGLLFLILSHEGLNSIITFIALPELTKDPNDFAMNYLITLGQNFSISTQHSVAIFALLHGVTKIAVIWLLLKRKLWAYPLAVAVFGIFITYEVYRYIYSRSLLLPVLIVIDLAIIVLVILEYLRLKTSKDKTGNR